MNAVLEKETGREVEFSVSNVEMKNGKPHMAIQAGTKTIYVPLHPGTIRDVHQAMENFWKDLTASKEVQDICHKHNVIIE
ncbi:hypothetical protein D1872_36330 [compost metagenome]